MRESSSSNRLAHTTGRTQTGRVYRGEKRYKRATLSVLQNGQTSHCPSVEITVNPKFVMKPRGSLPVGVVNTFDLSKDLKSCRRAVLQQGLTDVL